VRQKGREGTKAIHVVLALRDVRKHGLNDVSRPKRIEALYYFPADMQQNGIVKRISYPEVPPQVEYELTELGYSLADLVMKMEQWIVKHHSIILKARKEHA